MTDYLNLFPHLLKGSNVQNCMRLCYGITVRAEHE